MKTTKLQLHSQLRLMKDMRNMATLNRRAADPKTIQVARTWEARFDRAARRLLLRLRAI